VTRVQADHLLTLLRDAKAEGCYYGPRDTYWKRHETLITALEIAVDALKA